MAEPQDTQRDPERDAVEDEEQQVLTRDPGAAAIGERPDPVADVGHRGGNDHGDDLRGEGLVIQRPLATGEAKQVEQADIHDQGDQADHPEFGDLLQQPLEAHPERSRGNKSHVSRLPTQAPQLRWRQP